MSVRLSPRRLLLPDGRRPTRNRNRSLQLKSRFASGTSHKSAFRRLLSGVLAESAYATMLRKSIGKPCILLVVRSSDGIHILHQGPSGLIYKDVFELPRELCDGVAILIDNNMLTAELILRAIEELRPLSLLQ